jgi:hypothetical protein
MGSKRFENFEQVQILIVSKFFFNIRAQKFFGLDYAAHYAVCKLGLRGPFWATQGEPGGVAE